MELDFTLPPLTVYIDKQETIKLINNNQMHTKTKHLDIKLHSIRDINKKDIILQYIPNKGNISDIFTEAQARPQFTKLVNQLNLRGEDYIEANLVVMLNNPIIILSPLLITTLSLTKDFLLEPEKSIHEIEVVRSYASP